jgi:hypothetical protein
MRMPKKFLWLSERDIHIFLRYFTILQLSRFWPNGKAIMDEHAVKTSLRELGS